MSKFEDFHSLLHSVLEQEKQFLLQHVESVKPRRLQGAEEISVPLVTLLIKYTLEQKGGPEEDKLKERLKSEGRLKSYPNTLFHAYKKVMKLVHQANADDPLTQLQHLLFMANWMRQRRKLNQIPDILEQAEKIAKDQEYFHEKIKIHQIRKFLFSLDPRSYDLNYIQDRIKELQLLIDHEMNLELLADDLQLRKILLNSDQAVAEEHAISPLLRDIKECKSVRARLHFLRAWISIHIYRRHFDKALKAISEFLATLESPKQFLLDTSLAAFYYQYAFSGVQTALALRKSKEAERFGHILEDTHFKAADPARYFEFSTRIWLWKAEFGGLPAADGTQKLNEIRKNLDRHGATLGEGADIIISHQVATLLMSSGAPGKAIPWIQRYQRSAPGLSRPDLVGYAYVFFVIAKFELMEWDMVERGKRSALNFLQKNEMLNPFYEKLLKGMAKASIAPDEKTRSAFLKIMLVEAAKPENQIYHNYFDHRLWLNRLVSQGSK